ncbi:MAG: hypothetical protein K9L68_00760 [Spirochaetales bacterium]|nr:hypothetical protein [Spirochaetales bacterium]MCF7937107.1 hypothetical protein [Spirochaetales bacterium]
MKDHNLAIILLAGALLLFSSCQDLFTTSAFEFLQRDPSDLSLSQQIVYAENALASGDEGAIQSAYEAIGDSLADDPNDAGLNSLYADLAIEVSGVSEAVSDLMGVASEGNLDDQQALADELNDQLGDYDYSAVSEAQSSLETSRDNGGEVTQDQYAMVAVGMLMDVANSNGQDINNINDTNDNPVEVFLDDSIADLDSRGEDTSVLDELKALTDSI